jgi:hypothetical protein
MMDIKWVAAAMVLVLIGPLVLAPIIKPIQDKYFPAAQYQEKCKMTFADKLKELRDRATETPWRACTWDVMERPHVHKDMPDEGRCSGKFDLPLNAADAELIAFLANHAAEIEALVRAAHGLSFGEDWNNGTHAKTHGYREKLLQALAALEDK